MSDKFGFEEIRGLRTSLLEYSVSANDVELVQEPLWEYKTDDDVVDAVLPDEEAELTVTRIFHQANGSGSFTLHNGDNEALVSVSYSAGVGSSVAVNLPIGGGNPLKMDLTVTDGKVNVYVEYSVRRKVYRKYAAAYVDA